jgi:hypothetical protein
MSNSVSIYAMENPLDDAMEKALAILSEHADNVIVITQTGKDYPYYDYRGSHYAIKGSMEHVSAYIEVCDQEGDGLEWVDDDDSEFWQEED